jgi:hypothetical protein
MYALSVVAGRMRIALLHFESKVVTPVALTALARDQCSCIPMHSHTPHL